ncbi:MULTISPECIES: hypothetical protein [Sorangium]|uniref:hypothetical protein n=1 Tax=Sorangium TaxID=39643 RepID=UPI003D9C1C17
MATGMYRFRFIQQPDECAWRARLRDEVGARRSNERNVETCWHGDREAGTLEVLSMDAIALAYAAKVCVELGGEPALPMHARHGPIQPPWTATRWIAMPWWTRARIWFGPTRC